MKDAPKVRRDGKCHTCKGQRTFNYQRGVPRWAYDRDPFCSSACARKYFGTALATPDPKAKGQVGYLAEKHRGVAMKLKKTTKQAKYA